MLAMEVSPTPAVSQPDENNPQLHNNNHDKAETLPTPPPPQQDENKPPSPSGQQRAAASNSVLERDLHTIAAVKPWVVACVPHDKLDELNKILFYVCHVLAGVWDEILCRLLHTDPSASHLAELGRKCTRQHFITDKHFAREVMEIAALAQARAAATGVVGKSRHLGSQLLTTTITLLKEVADRLECVLVEIRAVVDDARSTASDTERNALDTFVLQVEAPDVLAVWRSQLGHPPPIARNASNESGEGAGSLSRESGSDGTPVDAPSDAPEGEAVKSPSSVRGQKGRRRKPSPHEEVEVLLCWRIMELEVQWKVKWQGKKNEEYISQKCLGDVTRLPGFEEAKGRKMNRGRPIKRTASDFEAERKILEECAAAGIHLVDSSTKPRGKSKGEVGAKPKPKPKPKPQSPLGKEREEKVGTTGEAEEKAETGMGEGQEKRRTSLGGERPVVTVPPVRNAENTEPGQLAQEVAPGTSPKPATPTKRGRGALSQGTTQGDRAARERGGVASASSPSSSLVSSASASAAGSVPVPASVAGKGNAAAVATAPLASAKAPPSKRPHAAPAGIAKNAKPAVSERPTNAAKEEAAGAEGARPGKKRRLDAPRPLATAGATASNSKSSNGVDGHENPPQRPAQRAPAAGTQAKERGKAAKAEGGRGRADAKHDGRAQPAPAAPGGGMPLVQHREAQGSKGEKKEAKGGREAAGVVAPPEQPAPPPQPQQQCHPSSQKQPHKGSSQPPPPRVEGKKRPPKPPPVSSRPLPGIAHAASGRDEKDAAVVPAAIKVHVHVGSAPGGGKKREGEGQGADVPKVPRVRFKVKKPQPHPQLPSLETRVEQARGATSKRPLPQASAAVAASSPKRRRVQPSPHGQGPDEPAS